MAFAASPCAHQTANSFGMGFVVFAMQTGRHQYELDETAKAAAVEFALEAQSSAWHLKVFAHRLRYKVYVFRGTCRRMRFNIMLYSATKDSHVTLYAKLAAA
eukprot:1158243-Pelagomonas_calceolata.AAC.12